MTRFLSPAYWPIENVAASTEKQNACSPTTMARSTAIAPFGRMRIFSIGIITLISTSIDAYAQKADAYFQEMLMLLPKVDRLERWVMELTDKLNAHLQA
jgi:hypothetical protein